jgi:hypothetical protein
MTQKPDNEPHERYWLIHRLPKCKATSKRTGQGCQAPAMANGCCRFHGGKSTGPKTPQGLEHSRMGTSEVN